MRRAEPEDAAPPIAEPSVATHRSREATGEQRDAAMPRRNAHESRGVAGGAAPAIQ